MILETMRTRDEQCDGVLHHLSLPTEAVNPTTDYKKIWTHLTSLPVQAHREKNKMSVTGRPPQRTRVAWGRESQPFSIKNERWRQKKGEVIRHETCRSNRQISFIFLWSEQKSLRISRVHGSQVSLRPHQQDLSGRFQQQSMQSKTATFDHQGQV